MKEFRTSLSAFLHRKDCIYTQIFKYVFCGGISVVVDQVVFYILAWLVFPCLRQSDPIAKLLTVIGLSVQDVSEQQVKTNYWIIKVICFLLSNAVVYFLNVRFVFHGGRHRKVTELVLFFGFSMLQFLYIWLGIVLINRFGWEVTYANICMLVLGIATNYITRKKIVFKG